MGADSKLFMKNGMNVLALANYIKSVYGKSEVVDANLGIPGCYSLFFENKDGEPRRIWFYTYEPQEETNTPVPIIDGKSCSLSLGYWGNSVEILEDIAKNFGGGYIQENDCGSLEDKTSEWRYMKGENGDFVTDVESKVFMLVEKNKHKFNNGLDTIKLTRFIFDHLDEIKKIS